MGQTRYTDRVYARNDDNEFVRLPSAVIADVRLAYDLSLPAGSGTGKALFGSTTWPTTRNLSASGFRGRGGPFGRDWS